MAYAHPLSNQAYLTLTHRMPRRLLVISNESSTIAVELSKEELRGRERLPVAALVGVQTVAKSRQHARFSIA